MKYGIETFYLESNNDSPAKPKIADHVGDFITLAQILGVNII